MFIVGSSLFLGGLAAAEQALAASRTECSAVLMRQLSGAITMELAVILEQFVYVVRKDTRRSHWRMWPRVLGARS